jgi:hypothetical protein
MLTETDPARAIGLLNDQLIRGGIGDRFVTLGQLGGGLRAARHGEHRDGDQPARMAHGSTMDDRG